MKSRFKEVLVKAECLRVDLDDVLNSNVGKIQIAYILHDRCVLPHYHIILDFLNSEIDNEFVAHLFRINRRCVCSARATSWSQYKKYLISTHDYKYSENDIISNFDLSVF